MYQASAEKPDGQARWYIIIYRLPSTPSTPRVTAWKKVKELGALPLQQSVYILPALLELKNPLTELKEQILSFSGECRILEIASLEKNQEQEMIAGFNLLRNQEYEEIIDECEAFYQEIDNETKAGKFYFAEEEEIEKRLEGLQAWFETVAKRDFFHADLRSKASSMLRDCRRRLDDFSEQVFSREQAMVLEGKTATSGFRHKTEAVETRKRMRETGPTSEILRKLEKLVKNIQENCLTIGEDRIEVSPDRMILDMKYRSRESDRSLEINIEWEEKKKTP